MSNVMFLRRLLRRCGFRTEVEADQAFGGVRALFSDSGFRAFADKRGLVLLSFLVCVNIYCDRSWLVSPKPGGEASTNSSDGLFVLSFNTHTQTSVPVDYDYRTGCVMVAFSQ